MSGVSVNVLMWGVPRLPNLSRFTLPVEEGWGRRVEEWTLRQHTRDIKGQTNIPGTWYTINQDHTAGSYRRIMPSWYCCCQEVALANLGNRKRCHNSSTAAMHFQHDSLKS